MLSPGDIGRGVGAGIALTATLLVKEPLLVAIAYCALLVPLVFVHRLSEVHFKFALVGVLPVAIGLVILWGIVVGAAPGMPKGSSPSAGLLHAALLSLRLAAIAAIFQLCFLSISLTELLGILRNWGVRGNGIILVASTFTVWDELLSRSREIITARYARGLVPNRSFLTTARQIPFILRPLLIWSLHSGLARADMWHEQKLSADDHFASVKRGTFLGSFTLVALASVWLALSLASRT